MWYRSKVGRQQALAVCPTSGPPGAALIYSILISCRPRGINPKITCLKSPTVLPGMNINEIETILPANWKRRSQHTN